MLFSVLAMRSYTVFPRKRELLCFDKLCPLSVTGACAAADQTPHANYIKTSRELPVQCHPPVLKKNLKAPDGSVLILSSGRETGYFRSWTQQEANLNLQYLYFHVLHRGFVHWNPDMSSKGDLDLAEGRTSALLPPFLIIIPKEFHSWTRQQKQTL